MEEEAAAAINGAINIDAMMIWWWWLVMMMMIVVRAGCSSRPVSQSVSSPVAIASKAEQSKARQGKAEQWWRWMWLTESKETESESGLRWSRMWWSVVCGRAKRPIRRKCTKKRSQTAPKRKEKKNKNTRWMEEEEDDELTTGIVKKATRERRWRWNQAMFQQRSTDVSRSSIKQVEFVYKDRERKTNNSNETFSHNTY